LRTGSAKTASPNPIVARIVAAMKMIPTTDRKMGVDSNNEGSAEVES
jgi:hypothetical protein